MMNGALPPSSRLTRFNVFAHFSINIRPTRVDPVNESLRTVSLAVRASPIGSGRPVTTLRTPAGKPTRSASAARASAEKGVNSDGLITIVQPAASAGAHLRVIIAIGKFHGVIAAHTPTGCLRTMIRRSGVGAGMVSPYTRRASSENHLMNPAPYRTSPRDSASGLPCSTVMMRARYSRLHDRVVLPRATLRALPAASHEGKCAAAASIAWFFHPRDEATAPLRRGGMVTAIQSLLETSGVGGRRLAEERDPTVVSPHLCTRRLNSRKLGPRKRRALRELGLDLRREEAK